MTDSNGASTGPDLPDFLDRLLARHRPAAPARPGVVRVRPRLAGPFERVEAVREPEPDTDGTAPLWPTEPQHAAVQGEFGPAVREIRHRTERERTVVRTERDPAPEPSAPRPAAPPTPVPPLLRPAATATPRLRPVPDQARRADGRDTGTARPDPAAGTLVTERTAAAAVAPTPLRPSPVDTAAAREAARQSTARRQSAPAEQVVQVQIGRLEVTSAGQSPSGRRPAARDRREAAVSLSEYLARGRE
ncbi:hypothetical protein [Streptomyces boluensis]|uniref:Uncharacterized protein n=1 Tax=Streptomyces boluensis TaxID=1775135 RepID=A0A964UPJ4_9ACTN|nr:hypothetical protein [Streptomyces boluensis]NBE52171.1 hypothetical protein [Streptomyces boluensis]